MAPFRFSGPICQTREWYEVAEDGILTQAFPARPAGAPDPAGTQSAGQPAPATGDCAFLNPASTFTVRAPSQAFTRLRGNNPAATLSQPQARNPFNWPHGPPSAAVERQVTIGTQTITVILPADAQLQGKNLPTINQLADALRAIPADQRAHTTRVILSPNGHPDSTPDRTVGGSAGSGDIILFPLSSSQSQIDIDNRVMHESGHNYQGSLWHSGSDVRAWQNAATRDNRLPSRYAGENAGDDFCEFSILFNAARGTPCEAAAKGLYPNRWATMVGYASGQSGP